MPYPFNLPDLGYPYQALEPHIDAQTMEIHHQKHHGAYVANLNAALEKHPYLHGVEVEVLLRHLAALPAEIQTAVRNNGGGHLNHSLFWKLLTPGGAKEPVGELKRAIDEQFGSFQALKEKLTQVAMGRFGSGWAWLVKDPFGKLHVLSTPNQDNPVMEASPPSWASTSGSTLLPQVPEPQGGLPPGHLERPQLGRGRGVLQEGLIPIVFAGGAYGPPPSSARSRLTAWARAERASVVRHRALSRTPAGLERALSSAPLTPKARQARAKAAPSMFSKEAPHLPAKARASSRVSETRSRVRPTATFRPSLWASSPVRPGPRESG